MRIGKVFVLISATFSLSCSNLANAKEEGSTPEEIANVLLRLRMNRDESEVLDGAHGQHEVSPSNRNVEVPFYKKTRKKFLSELKKTSITLCQRVDSTKLAMVSSEDAYHLVKDIEAFILRLSYFNEKELDVEAVNALPIHIKNVNSRIDKLKNLKVSDKEPSLIEELATEEELAALKELAAKEDFVAKAALTKLKEAIMQLEGQITVAQRALSSVQAAGLVKSVDKGKAVKATEGS